MNVCDEITIDRRSESNINSERNSETLMNGDSDHYYHPNNNNSHHHQPHQQQQQQQMQRPPYNFDMSRHLMAIESNIKYCTHRTLYICI